MTNLLRVSGGSVTGGSSTLARLCLRNTHAIVKQVTMDYGTLRVATPDGQIREYPITTPSVVIGRADGNQVVIDHVSVSRRHASMVIESGRVTID